MAYKLIWSPASRDNLRDIVTFISRDSRQRAETFGYRLIAETDKLQTLSGLFRAFSARFVFSYQFQGRCPWLLHFTPLA